jgi:hypothetical protein
VEGAVGALSGAGRQRTRLNNHATAANLSYLLGKAPLVTFRRKCVRVPKHLEQRLRFRVGQLVT